METAKVLPSACKLMVVYIVGKNLLMLGTNAGCGKFSRLLRTLYSLMRKIVCDALAIVANLATVRLSSKA